jgi:hypothetical protein
MPGLFRIVFLALLPSVLAGWLLHRRMKLTRLEMTATAAVFAVVGEASFGHQASATRAARKRVALPFIQPMQLACGHEIDLHLQSERRGPVVHIRVVRR